jgi:hypothetical protein
VATNVDPTELLGDLVEVVRALADQAPAAGDSRQSDESPSS